MKKNVIIKWLICLVFVLAFVRFIDTVDTTVKRKGTVEKVENNIVQIVDKNGNVWEWEEEEGERFKTDDKVILVMNNNHTIDCLEDDIILKIKLDK